MGSICAWCEKLLHEDGKANNESHGICGECTKYARDKGHDIVDNIQNKELAEKIRRKQQEFRRIKEVANQVLKNDKNYVINHNT
jgi:hypothetical protein